MGNLDAHKIGINIGKEKLNFTKFEIFKITCKSLYMSNTSNKASSSLR